MGFTSKPRRFVTPPSRARPAPVSVSSLVRTVLLAAMVVMAAAWALLRHDSARLQPMLVPVAPPSPAYDEGGEMPVPEMIEPDAN
jgi:hypothetical protein